eukprot:Rmarinus@m.16729
MLAFHVLLISLTTLFPFVWAGTLQTLEVPALPTEESYGLRRSTDTVYVSHNSFTRVSPVYIIYLTSVEEEPFGKFVEGSSSLISYGLDHGGESKHPPYPTSSSNDVYTSFFLSDHLNETELSHTSGEVAPKGLGDNVMFISDRWAHAYVLGDDNYGDTEFIANGAFSAEEVFKTLSAEDGSGVIESYIIEDAFFTDGIVSDTTLALAGKVDVSDGYSIGFLSVYGKRTASEDIWEAIHFETHEGRGAYGQAVHSAGDLLIVGDPGETPLDSGKVHLYEYIVSESGEYVGLEPVDVQSASPSQQGDMFGYSVVATSDYVAVGAPGYNSSDGRVDIYAVERNTTSGRPREMRLMCTRISTDVGGHLGWSLDVMSNERFTFIFSGMESVSGVATFLVTHGEEQCTDHGFLIGYDSSGGITPSDQTGYSVAIANSLVYYGAPGLRSTCHLHFPRWGEYMLPFIVCLSTLPRQQRRVRHVQLATRHPAVGGPAVVDVILTWIQIVPRGQTKPASTRVAKITTASIATRVRKCILQLTRRTPRSCKKTAPSFVMTGTLSIARLIPCRAPKLLRRWECSVRDSSRFTVSKTKK